MVGLPGCARSPAVNGADWVLERLAAGIPVGDAEIAAMGVGGLLKEIAARPQPREGRPEAPGRPRVAAIVLAAGAARRMRGRDKLLEPVGGRPVLRVVAEAARASRVDAGAGGGAAGRAGAAGGARRARRRGGRGAGLGGGDGGLDPGRAGGGRAAWTRW